ncbi:MAG: YybH family protein [Sphingomicrobium sp.]
MIGRWRETLLGLLAASVSLAGCAQYRGADTAAVADEVRKDALALVADFNSGNAAAAAAQDAPDYVGIFHGTANTVGPTADLAGMKAQMAAAKVRWEIGAGKVTVAKAGDIALFEAPYTFTASDPKGVTSRDSGTWIAIFRRQDDGRMKLWRSIGSDRPPAK